VAAPSAGALTTAGYTQSPTGVWTNTFGTISVVFNLNAAGGLSGGVLTVTPSGDNLGSDIQNAQNSLVSLGYPGFATSVSVPVDLGSATSLQSFSMSL
jgi:hypothetical protein